VGHAIGAATADIHAALLVANTDISQAATLFMAAAAVVTQADEAGDCDLGVPAGPGAMTPIS
jgi:hypothetical protein